MCHINKSLVCATMDIDSATNSVKEEQLQVKDTAHSCGLEFTEVVPLTRDTNGSCTTESVNGDWSAEVKQENLAVVKQEPDDVCCAIYVQ